jgi:hypothetical protein
MKETNKCHHPKTEADHWLPARTSSVDDIILLHIIILSSGLDCSRLDASVIVGENSLE